MLRGAGSCGEAASETRLVGSRATGCWYREVAGVVAGKECVMKRGSAGPQGCGPQSSRGQGMEGRLRVARATGLASVKRWFHGLGSASLEAVSSPVGTRAGSELFLKRPRPRARLARHQSTRLETRTKESIMLASELVAN